MADTLLLIVRWLHSMAAVAWVGGAIFYWLVIKPAAGAGIAPALAQIGRRFQQLVAIAVGVLLLSGIVLAVDRLSEETATPTYFGVLSAKVAVAGWMFFVVWSRGRGAPLPQPAGGRPLRMLVNTMTSVNAVIVLGPVAFFLSDLLQQLVERGLAR
jgi:putative copper export protein